MFCQHVLCVHSTNSHFTFFFGLPQNVTPLSLSLSLSSSASRKHKRIKYPQDTSVISYFQMHIHILGGFISAASMHKKLEWSELDIAIYQKLNCKRGQNKNDSAFVCWHRHKKTCSCLDRQLRTIYRAFYGLLCLHPANVSLDDVEKTTSAYTIRVSVRLQLMYINWQR